MGEKYPALIYSDGLGGTFTNGIWEIDCDSWGAFEDRIEKLKEIKNKYIWRGQSSKKQLKPNIYRDYIPSVEMLEKHLSQFRSDMLGGNELMAFLKKAQSDKSSEFQGALLEYYKMIHPKADETDPKENYIEDFVDDIYWSIGQHNGLMTPLLDWTMDPYKALFFALCTLKKKNGERVVYGLAEKTRLLLKNSRPKKRYISLLTNLGFVQNLLKSPDSPKTFQDIISPMFHRINAQDGIFTKSLQRENVEKHCQRCYKFYKRRNQELIFLVKIMIPNVMRNDFLKKLEEKNITWKTMYPDLQGIILNCNLSIEPR